MVIKSPDIITVSVGDTRNVTVSFHDALDSGVTLSSPTAVEQTTSDLTITNVAVSTGTVDIEDNGSTVTVATGQALQFTVADGTAANSPYDVRCTVTSSASEVFVYDQQIEFC